MSTPETDDTMVLDPDTGLETSLRVAALVTGLAALICFCLTIWGTGKVMFGALTLLFLILCAAFNQGRGALDDRYIVDFAKGEVLFSRTFKGRTTNKMVSTLDQIAGVVLLARINSPSNGPSYWTYGLALYPRQGQAVTVSSFALQTYDSVAQEGREIAERMGIPFFGGGEKKIPCVQCGAENLQVNWRNPHTGDFLRYHIPMLVFMALSMVALVVVGWY